MVPYILARSVTRRLYTKQDCIEGRNEATLTMSVPLPSSTGSWPIANLIYLLMYSLKQRSVARLLIHLIRIDCTPFALDAYEVGAKRSYQIFHVTNVTKGTILDAYPTRKDLEV